MFQKSILAAAMVALPLTMSGEAQGQCGTVYHSNPGYSSTVYQASYASNPSSYRAYRRSPVYAGSYYSRNYSPYRSRYYSPYRGYDSPYGYSSRRYPSRYSAGYRFYGPTTYYGRGYGRGYGYGWPGYSSYGRSGISLYFGR